jgi:hypothetical protein
MEMERHISQFGACECVSVLGNIGENAPKALMLHL